VPPAVVRADEREGIMSGYRRKAGRFWVICPASSGFDWEAMHMHYHRNDFVHHAWITGTCDAAAMILRRVGWVVVEDLHIGEPFSTRRPFGIPTLLYLVADQVRSLHGGQERSYTTRAMPIATTLPQSNVTLRYPPHRVDAAGQDVLEEYQLLELPPEILKAVEGSEPTEPYPCVSLRHTSCRGLDEGASCRRDAR